MELASSRDSDDELGRSSLPQFPRHESAEPVPVRLGRHLANQVQLVFFRAGYMGACLVEAGTLSIAWVMTEELLRSVGSTWPAQRDHLARQSERIGDLLEWIDVGDEACEGEARLSPTQEGQGLGEGPRRIVRGPDETDVRPRLCAFSCCQLYATP